MIEWPEALNLARQFTEAVAGKTVGRVLPPTKTHKFCWFLGDPAAYEAQLRGCRVVSAAGFGGYAELSFDNGRKLAINDGVNPRLTDSERVPKDHQLRIDFTDGTSLVFTVAMYGGIVLHDGSWDNEYYRKSRDTEKDLFGTPGGYRTRMSKQTLNTGCPRCGGPITKEAYLGGSVYYCSHCQPL